MTLRLTLLFCAALFASSCNLETTDLTPTPPSTPTPTPPSTPTPTPPAGDDEEDHDSGPPSQVFLWKPVSENNGKLVVLLPASFRSVTSITVVGAKTETAARTTIANGGRPHYRFSSPGAAYGKNIRISGGGRSWTVADGSKRTSL